MRRCVSYVVWIAIALLASGCKEEGTINVHKLTLNGVKAVDASSLKNALATKQSSKIPFSKKKYFDRSRFDADLRRITAFYADRGYPDARVTSFDVKLNDKQDAVDLTINIAEGDPVKVVAVTFVGFEVIPPPHLATLEKQAPLKVGRPRDRQLVVTTHELALNELKDHGFPYATVSTNEDDGPSGKEAKLTFTAQPGKLAHFGEVNITGNKSVGENVIRRTLTFKPGELYQRSLVQDSQRRLYGMELFQFANIAPQDIEQQPEAVPIGVTVAEGNHQRVNFGVGYGSEEKGRVDAEYHHVNFLGGARSAGAHVRWSSLDRGIRLDLTQPYFFAPQFSLSGEGQDWYTYTPAYRSVVTGAKATLTHRRNAMTSWSVSITSERDSSSVTPSVLADPTQRANLIALGLNPITGTQSGTLNALGFDLQHSTADNVLNAHHGYQIAFHAEQAGRIIPGTFEYFGLSGDGRYYFPLGSVVLASRVQFGNIQPPSADPAKVPFAKKYFLGGATTVRGWGRFEISPLSGGLPIGGNSLFAFSEELRAALHGNLGGVLFLDAGNVWADSWGMKLNDLRYAVGPGLRYQTPIGPLRFDFGYQLNPIPGLLVNGAPQTRRWRIHFSIGQAY
ncbi:MAG TPA: outer membrane protein assembly factor BamA [Vicinamibacterales bacterium]|nr:outer membrane protein assembly factor BamA [Vicinamibacterales bacterium]